MTDLDQRAARILELQAKASPGPWSAHDGIRQFKMPGQDELQTVCNCGVIDAQDHAVAYAVGAEDEDHTLGEGVDERAKHYNAAFIAAAHEAADLIREQQREIAAQKVFEASYLAHRSEQQREIERLRARLGELESITMAYKVTVNNDPVKIDYSQMHGELRDAGPTPLRGRVTRRDE